MNNFFFFFFGGGGGESGHRNHILDTEKLIWNDLPDNVCSAKSLFIQKEVENLFLCKGIPSLVFWSCLGFSRWCSPYNVSGLMIMDLCFRV